MLDCHAQCVALAEFVDTLAAAPDADLAAARDDAVQAVADEPGSALLGSFVHLLVAAAASDGAELSLLRRAEGLWSHGRELVEWLGEVRDDLEATLEHPTAPDAATRFNAATVDAQKLSNEVLGLQDDVDALRREVLDFPHLPAHPRQTDLPIEEWGWGDLLPARRTDALTRTLLQRADDPRTLAFAVGATSAYGASAAGSAYLVHAVGGARRAHRFRDRLARNTVGAYLLTHHPAGRPPSVLAERLRNGVGDELAGDLENLLGQSIAATFDLTGTAPIPDLARGYRRLVEQLELLDRFDLPAEPTPPSPYWLERLWGDPANPPPSLVPPDVDVVTHPGGSGAQPYGPHRPASGSLSADEGIKLAALACGLPFLGLLLVDLVQAYYRCAFTWAAGDDCNVWDTMVSSPIWRDDLPEPSAPVDPGIAPEQVPAIADRPQVAELVQLLWEAHSTAWEAMSRARDFLAEAGLVSPTNLDSALYAQFTALPGTDYFLHREEPDPVGTFHRYPRSSVEEPDAQASLFPYRSPPTVFLDPAGGMPAAGVSMDLWAQVVRGEQEAENLDLDADRGFRHPCWRAPSASDDPVAVEVLGYDEQ